MAMTLLTQLARADSIVIKGDFAERYGNAAGVFVQAEAGTFSIVVDGAHSEIVLNRQDDAADLRKVVADGTNCYYLTDMSSLIKRRAENGESVGTNTVSATVIARGVPNLFSYSPAGTIWLAYASQGYLASAASQTPKQKVLLSGNIDVPSGVLSAWGGNVKAIRETRESNWSLLSESGLPKQLIVYEPGEFRRTVSGAAYKTVPHPSPYSNGFTNTIYTVSEVTNAIGTTLPQVCTLTTYWMKPDGVSSNDLQIRYECTLTTRDCRVSKTTIDIPPKVPGIAAVSEHRFIQADPSKKPFVYIVSDAVPSNDRVKSSLGYAMTPPARQPYDIARTSERVRIAFIVTLIVLGSTCWLYFFGRKRQDNKNHKNT